MLFSVLTFFLYGLLSLLSFSSAHKVWFHFPVHFCYLERSIILQSLQWSCLNSDDKSLISEISRFSRLLTMSLKMSMSLFIVPAKSDALLSMKALRCQGHLVLWRVTSRPLDFALCYWKTLCISFEGRLKFERLGQRSVVYLRIWHDKPKTRAFFVGRTSPWLGVMSLI